MKKLNTLHRANAPLNLEAKVHASALGAVLRKARTSKGISRTQLGSRLLIGASTLQRMEQGDPRVSLGYYLAVGLELGVPVLTIQSSPHLAIPAVLGTPKSRAARKRSGDNWFS